MPYDRRSDARGHVRRAVRATVRQPHHVELTHIEKRVENWIRFGRHVGERIIDRRRRVLSFRPGSVFAFVRWAANDYGTVASRIDIVRAVDPGEPYQTLPFVRPGGEILLHVEAGRRSSGCSATSTPWKRRASIRATPRPITGVTSITGL